MKSGRPHGAKLRGRGRNGAGAGAGAAPIDLGMALSVYGKDADGRLVEIQAAGPEEPYWYGFSLNGTWPTEQ